MLELRRDHGIPYVPYRPLDAGNATPNGNTAVALSWLLQLGPHVAPIPGTGNRQRLADIVCAFKTAAWP